MGDFHVLSQVVPQVENEREVAAGDCHEDKVAEN